MGKSYRQDNKFEKYRKPKQEKWKKKRHNHFHQNNDYDENNQKFNENFDEEQSQ